MQPKTSKLTCTRRHLFIWIPGTAGCILPCWINWHRYARDKTPMAHTHTSLHMYIHCCTYLLILLQLQKWPLRCGCYDLRCTSVALLSKLSKVSQSIESLSLGNWHNKACQLYRSLSQLPNLLTWCNNDNCNYSITMLINLGDQLKDKTPQLAILLLCCYAAASGQTLQQESLLMYIPGWRARDKSNKKLLCKQVHWSLYLHTLPDGNEWCGSTCTLVVPLHPWWCGLWQYTG